MSTVYYMHVIDSLDIGANPKESISWLKLILYMLNDKQQTQNVSNFSIVTPVAKIHSQ